jgi:hypothetical protein
VGTHAPPKASEATGIPDLSPAAQHYLRSWEALTETQRTIAYASLLADTPAQVEATMATHGYSVDGRAMLAFLETHPQIVAHPADLGNFVNSLIGAGIGCAVGGFVGSFIPVVGTAAGCAIGAVATLLGIAYLTSSANGLGILHEDGIVRGQAQVFLNAQNASTAFLTNTLSLFNATQYAWMNAADSVAVNQLGNTSFNYTKDIAQSGIGAIFTSVLSPYVAQTSQDLENLNDIMYQLYSVPGLSNVHDYISFTSSGACLGVCASHLTWYGDMGSYEQIASGSPTFLEILPFSPVGMSCGSGSGTLINVLTNTTVATVTSAAKYFSANFTTASGGYYFYGSAGSNCDLNSPGALTLAASPSSGAASTAIIVGGCVKNAVPLTCNVVNATNIVAGQTPESIQAFNATGPTALMPVGHFEGGVWYAYQKQFNAMIQSAESNAYVYWFYLRTLGYTSLSAVPSGCLIPPPDLTLPPANLGNVGYSINFTEANYAAELNALATFYNLAPNTSSFCHGHSQFVIGNQAGTPFGENITGFVLTLPIGTAQKWKMPYTWAVNGSNAAAWSQFTDVGATNVTPVALTIWPEVITYGYAIPLNTVVQIPVNDPMGVDVLQTLAFYNLYGNGSAISSLTTSKNVLSAATTSSSPGAAIYLTRCIINKIAENPCLINGTSFSNATGTQSGGGSGPLFFPGGGECGISTPIVSTIVNGVASATSFFGNSIGCAVGWLVFAVIIIVVIVVVIAIVNAFRGKR